MVLNLTSIKKSYQTNEGTIPVLNGISLKLLAGETLALRGESGSGKSTLLHIAGALELPDTGSVKIAGATQSAVSVGLRNSRACNCQMFFIEAF